MTKIKPAKKMESDHSMADVLYQKLGGTWYAFTEVNGECYMSKVEEQVAEAKMEEQEEFFLDAINDLPSAKKSPRVA